MNTRTVRLVRNSTEWGLFFIGIALGLFAAVLAARSVCGSLWYYMDGFFFRAAAMRYHSYLPNMPPLTCMAPLGLIGSIGGGMLAYGVAARLRGDGPMSARVMRLVRGGAQVAIVVLSIALGLQGAVLVGAALNPAWMILLVPTGLIGGGMLGYGAAAQLWPPSDEGAN